MCEREASCQVANEIQLLVFKLDGQEYALEIANVVQTVRMAAIQPIPSAPPHVAGVLNWRGQVIPVLNLRQRLGLAPRPVDLDTQLLIARVKDRTVALIVDAVSQVLSLPTACLAPPEKIGARLDALSAVGKLGERLLLILDQNILLVDDLKIPSSLPIAEILR